MARLILSLVLALVATAASAQDDKAFLTLGGDRFLAGDRVTHSATGTDDLFMAGETVQSVSDITGSAHAAGRRVMLEAAIGQDAYAAGMDVSLSGPVAGDASLAGYDIVVSGPVGGDLRASGATVAVNAAVSGYALLAGETVKLDSTVSGDARIAGQDVFFGPDARIGGTLTLYEQVAGQTQVPDSVVPGDRLTRVLVEDWQEAPLRIAPMFSWWRAVLAFIGCVVVVTAIAALFAAVAPQYLAAMRAKTLDAPFRSVWIGFLMESALFGSAIVFAVSVIGILIAPAMIVLALLTGFFGYVVGAYTFGVGLLLAIGRGEPDTLGQRTLAAGIGALLTGLLVLVPFLGWLFMIVLTLAGVGAITVRLFRPAFFATA